MSITTSYACPRTSPCHSLCPMPFFLPASPHRHPPIQIGEARLFSGLLQKNAQFLVPDGNKSYGTHRTGRPRVVRVAAGGGHGLKEAWGHAHNADTLRACIKQHMASTERLTHPPARTTHTYPHTQRSLSTLLTMSAVLGENCHGKGGVRLLKVSLVMLTQEDGERPPEGSTDRDEARTWCHDSIPPITSFVLRSCMLGMSSHHPLFPLCLSSYTAPPLRRPPRLHSAHGPSSVDGTCVNV